MSIFNEICQNLLPLLCDEMINRSNFPVNLTIEAKPLKQTRKKAFKQLLYQLASVKLVQRFLNFDITMMRLILYLPNERFFCIEFD